MNTVLVIILVVLMIMVVVSLVRGVVAFLRSSRERIDAGEGDGPTEGQLMQNRMMFARIKYQAAAVLVLAIIMAMAS